MFFKWREVAEVVTLSDMVGFKAFLLRGLRVFGFVYYSFGLFVEKDLFGLNAILLMILRFFDMEYYDFDPFIRKALHWGVIIQGFLILMVNGRARKHWRESRGCEEVSIEGKEMEGSVGKCVDPELGNLEVGDLSKLGDLGVEGPKEL